MKILKDFFRALHALPEEVRKIFAGILIVAVGLVFFSMWGSFASSRLVALGPPAGSDNTFAGNALSPVGEAIPAPDTGGFSSQPLTPIKGVADTVAGIGEFISGSAEKRALQNTDQGNFAKARGFFALIGDGIIGVAEFLYMKLARYAPPNF